MVGTMNRRQALKAIAPIAIIGLGTGTISGTPAPKIAKVMGYPVLRITQDMYHQSTSPSGKIYNHYTDPLTGARRALRNGYWSSADIGNCATETEIKDLEEFLTWTDEQVDNQRKENQ